MPIACVNVDLDSIVHYLRIHGQREEGLAPEAARAVLRKACGRFCELFADAGIHGTFFAVGKDLIDPPSAAALKAAYDADHEIGNHTFSHDYDLIRRPADAIVREVSEAERAIVRAVGAPPKGFRAPGYGSAPNCCRRSGCATISTIPRSSPRRRTTWPRPR